MICGGRLMLRLMAAAGVRSTESANPDNRP